MRDKIEQFIIKSEEHKHPNYTFITIVLLTIFIIFGIVYYIKLNN
jgi:uncharacterized membrane protein